jgi:hypothetical protein
MASESPKQMGMSGGLPSAAQQKQQSSPKTLIPAQVNKIMNNKSKMTKNAIEDTVDKLKTPSTKSHRKNLEKMKMITLSQEEIIENFIIFRKSASNEGSPRGSASPNQFGSREGSQDGEYTLIYTD